MKWEYKIANLDVGGTTKRHLDEKDNKRLNEWGADGWELVAAPMLATGNGLTTKVGLIFKRPITKTKKIMIGSATP